MEFIDTHTHLFLEEFDDDLDLIIKKANQYNVNKFFLPNIDSTTIERVNTMLDNYPNQAFGLMGLHPCSVKENYKEELNIIRHQFTQRKYYGVGEIGLDYYWDKTLIAFQKEALRIQIKWAIEMKLPIILHSRDSFDDLFEIVEEMNCDDLTGIFHCFSGSVEDAEKVASLGGFYLGIGGVSTFKNGGMDKVLPHVNLDLLVLETDSPYLAPVPHRGKRNESSYIPLIGDRIATLQNKDIIEVATQTTKNALKVFQING